MPGARIAKKPVFSGNATWKIIFLASEIDSVSNQSGHRQSGRSLTQSRAIPKLAENTSRHCENFRHGFWEGKATVPEFAIPANELLEYDQKTKASAIPTKYESEFFASVFYKTHQKEMALV